jgi:hypothetical protein
MPLNVTYTHNMQILSFDSGAHYAPKLRLKFISTQNQSIPTIPESVNCDVNVTAIASIGSQCRSDVLIPETAVASSVAPPSAVRIGNVGLYMDAYPKEKGSTLTWWDAVNTCIVHGAGLCTLADMWGSNPNPFFGPLGNATDGGNLYVPFAYVYTSSTGWAYNNWLQVTRGTGYKGSLAPTWGYATTTENVIRTALTPCCGGTGHPAAHGVDGDLRTFWRSQATALDSSAPSVGTGQRSDFEELVLVLGGGGAYVSRVEIAWGTGEHAVRYNISVSYDGVTFVHMHSEKYGMGNVEHVSLAVNSAQMYAASNYAKSVSDASEPEALKVKRVRLTMISPAIPGAAYSVRELRAYGCTGQNSTVVHGSAKKVQAKQVMTPRVVSVTPSRGTTAGGSDVTIRGNFFSAPMQSLAVKFGAFACNARRLWREDNMDVSIYLHQFIIVTGQGFILHICACACTYKICVSSNSCTDKVPPNLES